MIRRRRDRDDDESFDQPEPAPAKQERLTPVEVQQKVFRLAFRGYNERDVDEFLDRVTEDLAALHEENKRLRESLQDAGGAPAAIGPSQRQAEQIVREAREHAARLVEDAERRAGEIRSAAAAAAPPTPPAAPATGDLPASFLTKEREFLRRLAGMVQDHARSLKEEAARTKPAAAPPTSSPQTSSPPTEGDEPQASALAFAQRAVETEPEPPVTTTTPSAAEVAGERIPTRREPASEVVPPASNAEGAEHPEPSPPIASVAQAKDRSAPSEETVSESPGSEEQRAGPWGPAEREVGTPAVAPWSSEERDEGRGDADPLISAWESAFVGGGPETAREAGTSTPASEGADRDEEKPPQKREDEPSLKELFWGEQ